MKTALAAIFLAGSFACASGPSHTARGRLAEWNDTYPEAARELCGWASLHPRASDEMLYWVAYNGPRAQELIDWSVTHPGQPVDGFLAGHPGFTGLQRLSVQHGAAVNQWLDWTRRNPEGAHALAARPGATRYAARRGRC